MTSLEKDVLNYMETLSRYNLSFSEKERYDKIMTGIMTTLSSFKLDVEERMREEKFLSVFACPDNTPAPNGVNHD